METQKNIKDTKVAEAALAVKVTEVKKINSWANKERDKYGYIKGTKTAMIVAMLGIKKYTKAQILAELEETYTGANNKTTLNLLLNDIQKPVGTYSASRGLKIKETKKGVLSLTK